MTGNDLKERREALGSSQERLAIRLGVSSSTVARWEQLKDVNIPNSKMLDLSLEALEIPNLQVLEYSLTQGAFHNHRIKDMLHTNTRMLLKGKTSNDFLVVGVAKTFKGLKKIRSLLEDDLKKARKIKKEEELEAKLERIRKGK